MCHRPVTFGEHKVACRTCDACLQTRRETWITRMMAEKAIAAETFSITLTYSPLPNGETPIGAIVFRYTDIQTLLNSIRKAYRRKYCKTGEIRYVIAGEQGSKGTQRIHWHLALFTDEPLAGLGKWFSFPDGSFLEDGAPLETNVIWSLWPHGHVRLQSPSIDGFRYLAYYALKDQIGVTKSQDSNRVSRGQMYASSRFMMSKQPPIGWRYLQRFCDELAERRTVWPSLKIPVPDAGYWYPTGAFRQYVLSRFREINEDYLLEFGKPVATWQALFASLADETEFLTKDQEALEYGEIEVEETLESIQRQQRIDALELANRARTSELRAQDRRIIRECGGARPCDKCFASLSSEELQRFESLYYVGEWRSTDATDEQSLPNLVCNSFCRRREEHQPIFDRARTIRDLGKSVFDGKHQTAESGRNTGSDKGGKFRIYTRNG